MKLAGFDQEKPAPVLRSLHRGEQEAILLAQHMAADVLLVDEKAARRAVTSLGLQVMGLVGVLEVASQEGRVDTLVAVARLRRTNFRVSASLIRDLLEYRRGGGSEAE